MDPIPVATHVAEVAAIIDDLERGLPVLPLSKAVNRIDDWRRKLLDTERDDLRPLADGLGDLHAHLTGARLDGTAIGALLVRLGQQTEDVAGAADEALQKGLRRLGSLLRHAGHALAGNASAGAPDDTAGQPAGSDSGPDTAGTTRSTTPEGAP